MPLAWGIFLPFCARAARRAAGRACAGRKTYIQIVLSLLLVYFARAAGNARPVPHARRPMGRRCRQAGRGASGGQRQGRAKVPAAGSGKGGQKWQRRVAPLAVNSAGHWGSTGGRGTALAEGNSAGSGRRHGPRTAQAIGAAPMGKAAPAAGNKACGAGLAHLRNFWYTGSRTHAAGGTGQSGALRRHTARGRALPLAPAARRRACWRQCIGGAAARTRQRGGKAQ